MNINKLTTQKEEIKTRFVYCDHGVSTDCYCKGCEEEKEFLKWE